MPEQDQYELDMAGDMTAEDYLGYIVRGAIQQAQGGGGGQDLLPMGYDEGGNMVSPAALPPPVAAPSPQQPDRRAVINDLRGMVGPAPSRADVSARYDREYGPVRKPRPWEYVIAALGDLAGIASRVKRPGSNAPINTTARVAGGNLERRGQVDQAYEAERSRNQGLQDRVTGIGIQQAAEQAFATPKQPTSYWGVMNQLERDGKLPTGYTQARMQEYANKIRNGKHGEMTFDRYKDLSAEDQAKFAQFKGVGKNPPAPHYAPDDRAYLTDKGHDRADAEAGYLTKGQTAKVKAITGQHAEVIRQTEKELELLRRTEAKGELGDEPSIISTVGKSNLPITGPSPSQSLKSAIAKKERELSGYRKARDGQIRRYLGIPESQPIPTEAGLKSEEPLPVDEAEDDEGWSIVPAD